MCFASLETSENAQNKAQSTKQKANSRNVQRKKMKKPTFTKQLGRDTSTGGAQA
jgi:hypothetical protein